MKNTKTPTDIKKILWVRPDGVGDATLAASMLPLLRERFKQSEIHVVCRSPLYNFYAECPHIDKVIAFNLDRFLNYEPYRIQLTSLLAQNKYGLCLDSSRSPTFVTQFLIENSGAEVKINYGQAIGETAPSRPHMYHGPHISELKSHKNFINKIGCNAKEELNPLIWIPHHTEVFADKIFEENNLKRSNTIVLAPGCGGRTWCVSDHEVSPPSNRDYDHYGEALEAICKEKDHTLLLVGAHKDLPAIRRNLRNFNGKTVDLVGKSSILEMAAIIKRSCLFVGPDSGAAHLACAVGTPNAIILGGGEYGRFFPYSPVTYVATLPLDCFGCLWDCKFDHPYCIDNVLPKTLEEAIRGALESSDKKTYYQKSL